MNSFTLFRRVFKFHCFCKIKVTLYFTFFDQIRSSTVFTNLDFRSSYNQIRIREDDVWKTAFRTSKEQYKYLVIPFGIKNAPATFQRFINHIMSPFLYKFVTLLDISLINIGLNGFVWLNLYITTLNMFQLVNHP